MKGYFSNRRDVQANCIEFGYHTEIGSKNLRKIK